MGEIEIERDRERDVWFVRVWRKKPAGPCPPGGQILYASAWSGSNKRRGKGVRHWEEIKRESGQVRWL